ncbi:hypothetical protein FQR65_LT11103 [Abscondita terminalis]|nr:hypothetical protein FQR65_LT11103 [Abscondita terminalis]
MKTIERIVKQSNNTKRELKEAVIKMRRQVDILSKDAIKDVLNELKCEKQENDTVDSGEIINKGNGNDKGTQTTVRNKGGQEITVDITEAKNYESWQKVKDIEWNETVFKNTKIKEGNPLNAEDDKVNTFWVEEEDTNIEKKLPKMYKEKYPELKNIEDKMGTLEKKITECVFKDENKEIEIYTPRRTQEEENKNTQQRQRNTYALVVDQKDKT